MANTARQARAKIELCEWLIKGIENDPDPRRDGAIAHLRAQIEQLQAELAEPAQPANGKPPDQVVRLKALKLFGEVKHG